MLPAHEPLRIGYVVKRYPRFSETFIVSEILAHEAQGQAIEIFSLRPPNDTHFQDVLSRVQAAVTYIPSDGVKAADLWSAISAAGAALPDFWAALPQARGVDALTVYQAVLLAVAARRSGIGHLHAHFASVATGVTRLAAHFAGLTYSFTAHAKDIFHESVEPDDLRRKLREAAAVITVSEYNLAYLQQAYGPAAATVQRVYNGLDLTQFPYAAPAPRPPVIAGVGRLVEKKGFADLIDACALLAQAGRAFQCRIVGGGELAEALQAQVTRLGLDRQVTLLGPRPQQEVIAAVQGAAVLAAPCVVGDDGNRDGLPTVLLEAMALGTPCVSTAVTGIPEAIQDGRTGVIVPQHDPPALAAALARLLDDAALRVRLAAGARQLIEAEFDSRRNTARLREIFRAAASSAPAPLQEAA